MNSSSPTIKIRALQRHDVPDYLQLLKQLSSIGDADSEWTQEKQDLVFSQVMSDSRRCIVLVATAASTLKCIDSTCVEGPLLQQQLHAVVPEPLSKTSRQRVVGAITLLIEQKFLHGGASVGHIEDVVVDGTMRGQQIGRKLIERAVQIADERGCYKTILDCSPAVCEFYEKCGFRNVAQQMRFDHKTNAEKCFLTTQTSNDVHLQKWQAAFFRGLPSHQSDSVLTYTASRGSISRWEVHGRETLVHFLGGKEDGHFTFDKSVHDAEDDCVDLHFASPCGQTLVIDCDDNDRTVFSPVLTTRLGFEIHLILKPL